MTQSSAVEDRKPNASLLIRGAIWIAIGALIAAALVCVVWVLVGDQNGLIGRAFLTILLLAGFAGIAILEAGMAPKRPDWLALTSMITWIVALIVGAIKIWLPQEQAYFGSGAERFFQLLLVVGILQLALLHVRLYTKSALRYVTTFTRVIQYVTLGLLAILVGMLVFFLTVPDLFDYGELYWRIVVALTILVAVGTTLIPLLNALFAPKGAAAAVPGAPGGALPPAAGGWPTYADGVTPLPALYDGSPDWNAYYTGVPTPGQGGYAAPAAPQTQSPVWVVPQNAPPQPEAQQSWTASEPVHQAPEAASQAPEGAYAPDGSYAPEGYAPQGSQPMPEPTPEPVIPGAPEPGVPGAPEPTIPSPEPELPTPEPVDPQPVPAPDPAPAPEPAPSPVPETPPAPGQPQPPSGPPSPQHPPAPGAFPPPPPAPAPPQ